MSFNVLKTRFPFPFAKNRMYRQIFGAHWSHAAIGLFFGAHRPPVGSLLVHVRTEGRFKAGFKVYMQQRETWLEQWWLALSGGNSSQAPNQRLVTEVKKENGMVEFESGGFKFSRSLILQFSGLLHLNLISPHIRCHHQIGTPEDFQKMQVGNNI